MDTDNYFRSDSGIGLETTILFAREGAAVLMADISESALEKAVAKVHDILPDPPRLETVKCDVSKEADGKLYVLRILKDKGPMFGLVLLSGYVPEPILYIDEKILILTLLVEKMVAHLDSWGGVDIMFNNAGIMHADDADAVDTPEKIWDLTHSINVKGVWFGSKHAVLGMRKHKKTNGSIINTASVVALMGSATPQLAYTASKGAVLALTRELAIVHAKEGFRFNALCPAPLK